MRIVIMTVLPERSTYYEYLKKKLPTAEFLFDTNKNAMDTFKQTLQYIGNDAVLIMEDDALVGKAFYEKATTEIQKRPNEVIQFFSRRKKDIEIGSRYEPGSNFMYNICFYVPKGFAASLYQFSKTWERLSEHPTGTDLMVADFMKSQKMKYYLHAPSIVQHREGVSIIDPRRSSKRTSSTFIGEDD